MAAEVGVAGGGVRLDRGGRRGHVDQGSVEGVGWRRRRGRREAKAATLAREEGLRRLSQHRGRRTTTTVTEEEGADRGDGVQVYIHGRKE